MRRKPPAALAAATPLRPLPGRSRSRACRGHPWGSLANLGHLTELGASPRRVLDRLRPQRDAEDSM